jgi:hypothetical protein
MKIVKRMTLMIAIAVSLSGAAYAASGDVGLDPNTGLPSDFPAMTAHTYDANAIAPGYVFLAVALNVEGVGHYLMILNNDGAPVWYKKVGHDEIYNFGVMPNGLLHYAPFIEAHSYAGGGDVIHTLMDEDFNIVEEVRPGNGYVGGGARLSASAQWTRLPFRLLLELGGHEQDRSRGQSQCPRIRWRGAGTGQPAQYGLPVADLGSLWLRGLLQHLDDRCQGQECRDQYLPPQHDLAG